MLKPLSNSVQHVQGQLFEKKFTTLGRLLSYWNIIVGEDLANVSRPIKIRFRKDKRTKRMMASLDVATDSANAMLFAYRKDLMLEKINQLMGQDTVTDMKFVHYPIQDMSKNVSVSQNEQPISEENKQKLSSVTSIIEDDDIKQSLMNIGAHIYGDKS